MGGKGSGGGAGQQYIPYYVNGLFPLSFMVDDANLIGYVGRCYRRRAMHYTLAGTRKGLRVVEWVAYGDCWIVMGWEGAYGDVSWMEGGCIPFKEGIGWKVDAFHLRKEFTDISLWWGLYRGLPH